MPADGARGFLLSLLTESFAVRALLGSLAAVGLAGLAVRLGLVRSSQARRLLVLAPVLTAAVAAAASDVYLPQLWLTTANPGAAGQVLDLLGELRGISTERGIDLLLIAWATVAGALLARRLLGVVAVRRLLRRAAPVAPHGPLLALVARLAAGMRVRTPRVVLLPGCPGGSFTVGTVRPVVAVDPALLDCLDERELEGLLAHELAHVARKDTLLGATVGAFRDLAFFLPPIYLAVRWLRREQEESADELACTVTRRPAALASSILKVWDTGRWCRGVRGACAAVPALRPALAGDAGAAVPALSEGAKAVAARVERLIERVPDLPPWRRRAEVALASTVLAVGTSAAIVLPGWIASDLNAYSLSFAYFAAPLDSTGPGAAHVEAPAFATFRALAPAAPAADRVPAPAAGGADASAEQVSGCPCVETQAQLHAGSAATGPSRSGAMLWRSEGHDPWELGATRPARPLLTLTDSGPQVGVFLVGRATE